MWDLAVDAGRAQAAGQQQDGRPSCSASATTSSAASTSAWFPSETNRDTPSLTSAASSETSSARFPLCETSPIDPAGSRRREVELRSRVEDAHAVRPDEHRAARAHALDDGALAPLPLLADLAEAGRDGDDRARPGLDRRVDGLLEDGRRHGDDELRLVREVGQRAVCLPAEHRLAGAVDEVDRAPVLAAQPSPREPLAPFGGIV